MSFLPFSLAAVANHLWQSTLFAGAMWLLTLALKRNAASVRYGIWMAASVKFLVPFALLVALGGHFAWKITPKVAPASVVMEEIGQPFTAPDVAFETVGDGVSAGDVVVNRGVPLVRASLRTRVMERLPLGLLVVWMLGVVLGAGYWMRWLGRMRGLRRDAVPVELDGVPVRVMSSRMKMEPCVFGVLRPVLLLPEGITEQLTAVELEAVVAHEVSHVRRRDNLTAAMHLLVETVFWFWPVLRWIRVRLLEERERACDEAVLRGGKDPGTYAEGILKVCKFYLAAQPQVAAGVSGFNLKQRIEVIVSYREAVRMSVWKKMMLAAAAVMVVGAPVVFGQVREAVHAPMLTAVVRPMERALAPVAAAVDAAEQKAAPVVNADVAAAGSGQVMVTGNVRRPGGYLIGPQTTLLNVIKVAGGPTRLSDMRDVQLKRGGTTIAHLDLYSLLGGRKSTDTRLQPGDMVNFPAAKTPGVKDEQVLVMFDPGALGEETAYGRVYSMMTEGLKAPEIADPRPGAFVGVQFPSDASGICNVDLIVDSKGVAHVAAVRTHSSDLEFDARWIQAIEKTAWKPAMLDGSPVGSRLMMATGARLQAIGVVPQGAMVMNGRDLSGTWQGTISSMTNFRVVLRVERSGGGWSGLLYRPGVLGTQVVEIPVIQLQGDAVRFEIPAMDNHFEGKLNADGSSLVGSWIGGEKAEPLTLMRATAETAWDSPAAQTALRPMVNRDPSFEVATIKPALPQPQFGRPSVSWNGRKGTARATSAKYLLEFAYGVNDKQLVNAPDWLDKDKYDIVISVAEGEGVPNVGQWKIIVRKLLAERFQLQFHQEKRELAAFAITVAKGGPKLTKSSTGGTFMSPGMGFALRPNGLQAMGSNLTMADFAEVLRRNVLDRPVVDQTGLTGHYDIQFLFAAQPGQMAGWQAPPVNGESAEDLFSAVQDQLGLKLENVKAPVDVMVLDKVEQPSAN